VRLPKGHVEQGESAATAALREVREESGYAHVSIVADLGAQHVRFIDPYRKREVTRDERYFLMCLEDETKVAREEKEHQFIPIWVPIADAVAQLSFDSEKEFVRRGLRWIQENDLPPAA
jgi:8-oxo-dGTP pyrophosphatase MutT (NUDIX family)